MNYLLINTRQFPRWPFRRAICSGMVTGPMKSNPGARIPIISKIEGPNGMNKRRLRPGVLITAHVKVRDRPRSSSDFDALPLNDAVVMGLISSKTGPPSLRYRFNSHRASSPSSRVSWSPKGAGHPLVYGHLAFVRQCPSHSQPTRASDTSTHMSCLIYHTSGAEDTIVSCQVSWQLLFLIQNSRGCQHPVHRPSKDAPSRQAQGQPSARIHDRPTRVGPGALGDLKCQIVSLCCVEMVPPGWILMPGVVKTRKSTLMNRLREMETAPSATTNQIITAT